MKKIVLILLFLVFGIPAVQAQPNYYLEGRLGKRTIYLKYSYDDAAIYGSYFYKSSLKDILLQGFVNKNKYILQFENRENKIFEKFELTKNPNQTFTGFWTNGKGKKISVQLRPIDFSKFKSKSKLIFENKLDWVKMNLLRFKQDSVSSFHGKELIWYSEKHSTSPFFRLGNQFSENSKAQINPRLKAIQIQNTIDQLNCATSFEYNTANGIQYAVTVNYLTANLIGFHVFTDWDCGAHSDFEGKGYLIDLNNGKEYTIDSLLAFDKSATTEEQGGFEAYSNYKETFFAPNVFELVNAQQNFSKPRNNEDCDYTNLDIWKRPSWKITEKGIEFTPSFYRAARNCELSFLLPFSALQAFKNPKFPYSFN